MQTLLNNQLSVSSIDLSQVHLNPHLMKLIPADIAYKYGVLPCALQGSTLAVAMADPSNIFAIDDIKFLTGYRIEAYAAPEDTLRGLLSSYYDRAGPVKEGISSPTDLPVQAIAQEAATALPELKTHGEQVPVISLVNSMLNDAINRGASDIHIEPYEHMLRVRFRIDGVLYDVMNPSLRLKNARLSRIKIIARLDIAERRLPQDGRIRIRTEKAREVDVRVSVLPTLFGEKARRRRARSGRQRRSSANLPDSATGTPAPRNSSVCTPCWATTSPVCSSKGGRSSSWPTRASGGSSDSGPSTWRRSAAPGSEATGLGAR